MNKVTNEDTGDETKGKQRLKKILLPMFTLLLVIAITVSIFFLYGRNPERLAGLKNYVYLGAFLISLIGNATVVLPGAVLPLLSAIGISLYPSTGPIGPIIVGLTGGIGAAIGEITGYMVGCSGRGIAKKSKLYSRIEEWMENWGGVTIFILSLVPFFFDIVGIVAGVLHFPLWKFFLLCLTGRTLLYVGVILLAAIWGWETLLPYFG
jgi:membrane protein DedA with SNARE-associated domain